MVDSSCGVAAPVVGSDQVVRAVGALSNFYAATNDDRHNRDAEQVKILVAQVCKAMRGGCFETSALTLEEIKSLVPIA